MRYAIQYSRYRDAQSIGDAAQIDPVIVPGKNEVPVPIDFSVLQDANADVYAWIRIPLQGEEEQYIANYPILQSPSDTDPTQNYYLTHDINRQKSVYGAIYTQDYNNKGFGDFNTLVYGHNMRDGSMFGTLKKYRDPAFFEANSEILVYMPGRILKYRIFAAYVYDDRHILFHFNNDNPLDCERYLDELFAERKMSANIDRTVPVTVNDRIITLSTCTTRDTERYLVQGVLIYDSNTDPAYGG